MVLPIEPRENDIAPLSPKKKKNIPKKEKREIITENIIGENVSNENRSENKNNVKIENMCNGDIPIISTTNSQEKINNGCAETVTNGEYKLSDKQDVNNNNNNNNNNNDNNQDWSNKYGMLALAGTAFVIACFVWWKRTLRWV